MMEGNGLKRPIFVSSKGSSSVVVVDAVMFFLSKKLKESSCLSILLCSDLFLFNDVCF